MSLIKNITIFVAIYMENQTKIYLNSYSADNGIIKIDVMGEDLPENLFGVSFHLKIDGSDWLLNNYETGNVFADNEPLFMVQEKHGQTNEIVTGITMKRGDEYMVSDGVLASFYIEPEQTGTLTMSFENNLAVGFDEARVDLNSVEWEGTEIGVEMNPAGKNVQHNIEEGNNTGPFFSHNALSSKDTKTDILGTWKTDQQSVWDVYIVLVVSFFVLSFGYLTYLWFIGRRNKN